MNHLPEQPEDSRLPTGAKRTAGMPGIVGAVLWLLVALVSCSREPPPQASGRVQAEGRQPVLATNEGGWTHLATLQQAGQTRHYYLQVRRQSDGAVTLAFHAATDAGFQPAWTVEESELTLLVAEQGKEGWSGKSIALKRLSSDPAASVVFQGSLPKAVQTLDLTAVIPRMRIGGQRVLGRFTMPAAAIGKE